MFEYNVVLPFSELEFLYTLYGIVSSNPVVLSLIFPPYFEELYHVLGHRENNVRTAAVTDKSSWILFLYSTFKGVPHKKQLFRISE